MFKSAWWAGRPHLLLVRDLHKTNETIVAVVRLQVIVGVPKLGRHHDAVLRASVSNSFDGRSMTAELQSQTTHHQCRNKEKSTRSKWPECRHIRGMPDAFSSCLPKPLHMLHTASSIASHIRAEFGLFSVIVPIKLATLLLAQLSRIPPERNQDELLLGHNDLRQYRTHIIICAINLHLSTFIRNLYFAIFSTPRNRSSMLQDSHFQQLIAVSSRGTSRESILGPSPSSH